MRSNDRHLEWERWDFPLELRAPAAGTPLPPNAFVVIDRGDDLSLHLTATSGAAPAGLPQASPGAVSTGAEFDLESLSGEQVRVSGFILRNRGVSRHGTAEETHTVEGTAASIRSGNIDGGTWKVLWLVNMRAADRIWPSTTTRSTDDTFTRTRPGEPAATIKPAFSNESFARDHVTVKIALPRCSAVTVGNPSTEHAPQRLFPGFVCLKEGPEGPPDDELCRRFQRIFDFTFGRPTALVGVTTYDANWVPLGGESRSSYLARGTASFEQASRPPAPLAQFVQGVDRQLMGDAVAGMMREYDALNLGHVIWQYQHALQAPLDIMPGYLRSAFEALRRAYFKDPVRQSKTQLLPKPLFKKVRAALEAALNALRSTKEFQSHIGSLDVVRNQLNNLNQQPLSRQTTLFLDEVGLQWGSVERDALELANAGSHGSTPAPNEYVASIHRTRALETLVARAVLAATGAAESYFDYSTLGHPIRRVSEAQGGPRGDGKAARPPQ